MNPVRWIITMVALGLAIAMAADAEEIGCYLWQSRLLFAVPES
jgi:hypothetical protein